MAAIEAWGSYLPGGLARKDPGPSVPPRTAAAWDEDWFTMAVEAGARCLSGRGATDPPPIDAVFLIRSTAAGEAGATALLEALGLDAATRTLSVPADKDAAADALDLALGAVESGASDSVLVIGASSPGEDRGADGAAAVLIGRSGGMAVGRRFANLRRLWPEPAGAAVVPARYDRREVVEPALREALDGALAEAGWSGGDIEAWSFSGSGKHPAAALDLPGEPLGDGAPESGAGAVDLLIRLAAICAGPARRALTLSVGERAAALLWEPGGDGTPGEPPAYPPPLEFGDHVLVSRRRAALAARQQINPMDYLRESAAILRFEGLRCEKCGRISTAFRSTAGRRTLGERCESCGGCATRVPLAREGTVRALTRSHMEADPSSYAICDLDGGGRLLAEVAGGARREADIGEKVDLVLRRGTAEAGAVFYLWKLAPRG
jgi:uncharacterized OB-fold protein